MLNISSDLISLHGLVAAYPCKRSPEDLIRTVKKCFMGDSAVGLARYLSRVSGLDCIYMVESRDPPDSLDVDFDYAYGVTHAALQISIVGWRPSAWGLYADVSGLWHGSQRPTGPNGRIIKIDDQFGEADLSSFGVEPVTDDGSCPSYGFVAGALPWLSGFSGLPPRAMDGTESVARLEAIAAGEPCTDEGWVADYIERERQGRAERLRLRRQSSMQGA